jgi:hypothetical protein
VRVRRIRQFRTIFEVTAGGVAQDDVSALHT